MNTNNTFLALIGHGTNGNEGIERGIHLRWSFRREMGFPISCFRLYRRLSGEYGTLVCLDFKRLRGSEKTKPFNLGSKKKSAMISSSHWPLALESRRLSDGRRRTGLERVLAITEANLEVELTECAYYVKVRAIFKARGNITLIAYAEGLEVDRSTVSTPSAGVRWVTVKASAIDKVILKARSVALVQVCYIPCERCEDHAAGKWVQVGDSICLPICYRDEPCKEPYDEPGCDWLNIENRLPEDPCIRSKYGGERAKELASVLRTLVNPEGLVAQADRSIKGTAVAEDCPPPGQKQPTINFRALDAVILAATDPIVAKVLGLYYVDDKADAGKSYDYKIVGDWPEGTLWHLTESLNFDHLPIRHRFPLNVFPVGELTFRTGLRPTVIKKPSKSAGTKNALAFRHTDDFDWNLPDLSNLPISKPSHIQPDKQVEIRFPEAVGEVQIHLGYQMSNVRLEAWDDMRNVKVTSDIISTHFENVLAVHGDQETDQITRIVLKGKDFWIYKICWQMERVSHGEHCAFVYGLRGDDAETLKPPQNVKAFELPGVVQKVADCQPLMEGETVDARYSVGVNWKLPLMQNQLLPKSPIRYHMQRIARDGTEDFLTEDSPVFVTPANQEVEKSRRENLPEGWPQETPYYVESGLAPGEYRYQAAGVDLFGRMSDFSAPSNAVSPAPLPPPSPPNVTAHFIDGKDPWLNKEDREALPQGIWDAVAIRLRWNWPADYERMAPDVQTFKVYYMPGVPNILLGNVTFIDGGTSTYVDIKAEIERLGSALMPENLLVGRLLYQGGKVFRILTHREGIVDGSKQLIVARLRLPLSPSENTPTEGNCSIALTASIPIEVSDLSENASNINAVIKTSAIHAVPHSGLETSRLTIGQIEAVINSINRDTLSGDYFEMEAQLTISDLDQKDQFLNIPTPFYAKLSLTEPGTGIYKDYSKVSAWSTGFNETIPKIGTGQYDLLIREKVRGESAGFVTTDPGRYTLIVDQFLPGLDVDFNNPRREGYFGVSASGQGGEGPVSIPACITRIYRETQVLSELQPVFAQNNPTTPADDVLEGPPNFEGKLTYTFSWNRRSGWRYEVYRTLDDTLYKVDTSIRKDIQEGKFTLEEVHARKLLDSAGRVRWLSNFPQGNHASIESMVIDPDELDLQAVEDSQERNVLLQALASLPLNYRSFTKLDDKYMKPDEADPDNKMVCIDDSLEGKAEGRYFYRVQAIDSVGNTAPMAISTRPIYVKGDKRPATPVITSVEGGDRKITIRWAAIPDPNIKGYHVYKTDDEARTTDVRSMGDPLKQQASDEYSVEVPDLQNPRPKEFEFIDWDIEPKKKYYYGVVATNADGITSMISKIYSSLAYDYSPPDEPTWIRGEWIKLDSTESENPWSDANVNLISAVALEFSTTKDNVSAIVKRSENRGDFGNVSQWFKKPVFVETSGLWKYKFYDKTADPSKENVYRLKLMTTAGVILDSTTEQIVSVPNGGI